MKIQLDLPTELNKDLKIERIRKDETNLEETITRILKEYFLRGGIN